MASKGLNLASYRLLRNDMYRLCDILAAFTDFLVVLATPTKYASLDSGLENHEHAHGPESDQARSMPSRIEN